MIIRNLANKANFPSTPLGVTCQAERSRGQLAYKTENLSLTNHSLHESGYSYNIFMMNP
jgi:hypothetical protein